MYGAREVDTDLLRRCRVTWQNGLLDDTSKVTVTGKILSSEAIV